MSAIVDARPRPAGPARPQPQRLKPAVPLSYLVALVIVAITLVPMLYVIIGGFRSNAQINASPTGLPHPWVWHNYQAILTSGSFWQNLGNSALIAVVVTALAVGLGSMASFALSRYHFRGREGWYLLFAVGLLFPANVASLPVYLLRQADQPARQLARRGTAGGRVLAAVRDHHSAAVHARDPRRARGRCCRGRRQPG